jgi:hypothetical protein
MRDRVFDDEDEGNGMTMTPGSHCCSHFAFQNTIEPTHVGLLHTLNLNVEFVRWPLNVTLKTQQEAAE